MVLILGRGLEESWEFQEDWMILLCKNYQLFHGQKNPITQATRIKTHIYRIYDLDKINILIIRWYQSIKNETPSQMKKGQNR